MRRRWRLGTARPRFQVVAPPGMPAAAGKAKARPTSALPRFESRSRTRSPQSSLEPGSSLTLLTLSQSPPSSSSQRLAGSDPLDSALWACGASRAAAKGAIADCTARLDEFSVCAIVLTAAAVSLHRAYDVKVRAALADTHGAMRRLMNAAETLEERAKDAREILLSDQRALGASKTQSITELTAEREVR